MATSPVETVHARVYVPTRSKALVAAATPASRLKREGRQLFQPWQAEALAHYDKLGPCHWPAVFHGQLISPIRLYLGLRDPQSGEITEIDDSKGILRPLEDPGGGFASLLSNYATLRFLIGESYLLETPDEDDPDGTVFEIVSPLELRLKPGTGVGGRPEEYQRIRAPGLTAEELIQAPDEDLDLLDMGEARVWRFHRRHPTYSDQADSPVRSLLHLYEELELLHAEARSSLRSRIARAGILFIDGKLSFTVAGSGEDDAEAEGAADEDPEADELLDALIEAMMAAITDQDLPPAPIIARVEAQFGTKLSDLFYHWKPEVDETFPSTERIDKLIGWIAQGTDLPPEVVLGFSDMNHWNAFLVDDQTWESHGRTDAVAFCQDVTEAYVRPKAQAEDMESWENVVCWFDPAEVTTDPDRSKNARELYIDGELSGDAYREARGWQDDDAPSDEERRRYLAIKLRDATLLGIEPAEAEEPPETDETGRDLPHSEPAQGPSEDEEPDDLPASANGRLEDALFGAAQAALYRGRELAGSRLLGLRRSCEDCFAGAEGVPKHEIAAYLGETTVHELATSCADLVAGAGACFADVAVQLGLDREHADTLARRIEEYAADTLLESEPSPVPL